MKPSSQLLTFSLLMLLSICCVPEALAQTIEPEVITTPVPVGDLSASNLFSLLVEPLYGALIVVLGYLSYLIPGIKKIEKTTVRVIVVGLVTGIGFYLYGVSALSLAVTYLMASGLYATILKWFVRSPKPQPA